MKIIALITILLLFGAANAQFDSILQPICGSLFSQSTSVLGSGGGSSPAFYIIEVALTIAVSVLLILGVLYAIGYGFGIDSLKAFVRTEYLESVFNLAMIVFISGGLAFAGSAVSFLSSVAGIGQTTTAPVTTISSAYGAICTNYVNYGAATVLDYAVEMSARLTVLDIFKNAFIIIEPNEFGFDGLFFSGLQPVDNIYSLQIDFYMAMAGMFIGIPVLLWMIYVLFPWFLYVGVLLRAFPWTRAAGGSFLALFIAFYIFFPAIILPFSGYGVPGNGVGAISCSSSGAITCSSGTPSCNTGNGPTCSGGAPVCGDGSTPSCQSWDAKGSIGSIMNLAGFVPSIIESTLLVFLGGAYGEVQGFGSSASAFAVQLIGVVISLLISLDLVEVLGDLLGAPSMHAKRLLSKVI